MHRHRFRDAHPARPWTRARLPATMPPIHEPPPNRHTLCSSRAVFRRPVLLRAQSSRVRRTAHFKSRGGGNRPFHVRAVDGCSPDTAGHRDGRDRPIQALSHRRRARRGGRCCGHGIRRVARNTRPGPRAHRRRGSGVGADDGRFRRFLSSRTHHFRHVPALPCLLARDDDRHQRDRIPGDGWRIQASFLRRCRTCDRRQPDHRRHNHTPP